MPADFYETREVGDALATDDGFDPADDRGFPWEFRPGTELVETWSLPDAAGRPDFGIPGPPEDDLPNSPFKHLTYFTEKDAEVFFGRGYQIRVLYEQITDGNGPPILLLHGASGVGKSSLLDAGLVPRVKAGGREVRYRRRDQRKGLLGTLRDALGIPDGRTDLDEHWRAEERLKPLDIFIDQVEECFTRPDAARPRELDEFVEALVAALGDRGQRPEGKLVLGFRKEWLAEIDRRLREANLPRNQMFLEQLDRRGIIEAIRGPTRPGRLQKKYNLKISDEDSPAVPEVIADNLLARAGSSLTPTLQLLLTKMWESAWQTKPHEPRFDRDLYESLKSEGDLLEDAIDDGLEAIGRWNREVLENGLALDVLAYHATELGYANECDLAKLKERYKHRDDVLDGLLSCCKDCYLIVDAETVVHPSTGSDLRLMSSANDVRDIPTAGNGLIIASAVKDVFHFRIFDRDGRMVVDTDETKLTTQAGPIEDLRKQLASFWPPHELTRSEKNRIITAVTSIVGHIPSTQLAHDLLAPLVLRRFRFSMAPGQRARRLLENRAPEWHEGKTGPVLDSTDLAAVEEGALGMRGWTADETRLVDESRRAAEQEKAEDEARESRVHEAEQGKRQAEDDKRGETEHRLKEKEESNQRLRKEAVKLRRTLAITVGVAAIAGLLGWEARHEANHRSRGEGRGRSHVG